MMKTTKTWVLIFLLLIPAINVHAWPIPDTGLTKCYNNNKYEIPCPTPGQSFYGQDGNYTINPPSYTKLDATGKALPVSATTWAMVKDSVTGLIWENKTDDGGIHDKDNQYTWCDTNPETNGGDPGCIGAMPSNTEGFIKALNDAHFGSFSDWRMPTVKELQSIMNYGRHDPEVDTTFFPNMMSVYWSSNSYAGVPHNNWPEAWAISRFGSTGKGYKSEILYVRAVRGGQSRILDHLMINGDGTVTDTATGLMWQQGQSPALTWEAALTYTESLSLAGYDDWRMPTVKELVSIVDFNRWNPAIDTTFFPGTNSLSYWSSTTRNWEPRCAWLVSFDAGEIWEGGHKTITDRDVRAVRAGPSRIPGHLIITAPGQGDNWKIGEQKIFTWDTAGIAGNVKIFRVAKQALFKPLSRARKTTAYITGKSPALFRLIVY
jgi:hypothetical protein